ncbi:hypothetical protein BV25DRAFT_1917584 [Artomyces pyxidatus]|uniref:Uncharacterized protein n=1 Tax=Artomyces pyxidatus TaxID=48021 RepID=A0ACB8SY41_9AGAM|nr:hypothetical protein BV25DRAFT_1917584 [Artomyces pyxidatus]
MDYDIQGFHPRTYAPLKPKLLIASPLRTSKDSHTKVARSVHELVENGESLDRIRHSRHLVGFLSKYCLARDQTLLNGPFHPGHPAFQPDANPPSSWSDSNTFRGTIPNALDQARVLGQLRDLYLVQTGRPTVIVNGEPAIATQFFSQVCEPINMMLKMRYRENGPLWRANGGEWLLPPGQHRPESLHPQWSPPVFENRKQGTQSKRLPKTPRAGDADGILSASLHSHPAFMEIKTWWAVSKRRLMHQFNLISASSGQFVWVGHDDSYGFIKQIWGEFNAYQTRLAAFVNGEHIAFVIRTRRNELTFSDFVAWEDREVYTAFLGFSMVAADAVLSGPPHHYNARLRDIINRICPPGDRKINANGQDHANDNNNAGAGPEIWTVGS